MQHLALIMDGNRRWAVENKLSTVFSGHRKGVDSVKIAGEFCIEKGIKYASFYTFSLENFKRSEEEKNYIFNFIAETLERDRDEFIKKGIRLKFCGDRSLFPKVTLPAIERIEKATEHLSALTAQFLFCYGGQQEIVAATRAIAQKVALGELKPEQITKELFETFLWTSGAPEPDLIIRTGSENRLRLSNFITYQSAYSEFVFLNKFWPDLTKSDLEDCYNNFLGARRNFGK